MRRDGSCSVLHSRAVHFVAKSEHFLSRQMILVYYMLPGVQSKEEGSSMHVRGDCCMYAVQSGMHQHCYLLALYYVLFHSI